MNDKTIVLTDAEFRAISTAVAATMKWGPLRESITAKLHAAIDAADIVPAGAPIGTVVRRLGGGALLVRLTGTEANRASPDAGVDYSGYRRFYAIWSGGKWHASTQGAGSTKLLTGGGTIKNALASWERWAS